jgi:hypothetical protein
METRTDFLATDEHRRKWVENQIAGQLGDNPPLYSELSNLLHKVSKEAAEQAVAAGYSPFEPTAEYYQSKFDKHLSEAIEPVLNIRWTWPHNDEKPNGDVWNHRRFLLSDVRGKLLPEFQRRDFEEIAGTYLQSNAKTATVDRLLVDLLVGMEFAQFADSQLNAPHVPFIAPNLIKRNPPLDWFIARLTSAVMGMVGYLLFWGVSKIGLFPDRWLWIVVLILLGLFLLEAAWSLIVLPKHWMVVRKEQRRVREILEHMSGAYSALGSDGPISAQHVSGLLARATENGVVWPGPVHVLLEDIIARGGRF